MKRLAVFLLLGLVFGACTDAGPTATELETLTLSIVGPPHRTGLVGQELTDPLTVYLETTLGKKTFPAKGVLVNFVVTQGAGKVYAGAAVTDANGLASDYWTLGPGPGHNELEVRAVRGDGTKDLYGTFTATGHLGVGLGVGFGPEQWSLIPAGTFQMGDMVGTGVANELPVHTVNITRAFYLQRTQVTQGQWKSVMGSNPSHNSECGDTCPVEHVSWNDAQEFLERLNGMFPGRNYRLPTEAEWEYACRAGTIGDYAGTGSINQMGWVSENSGGTLHPVAQKLPNQWGLFDMHGNVWEWAQDWYHPDYYSVSPTDDPTGPDTGTHRILRGGSWDYSASGARSAFRGTSSPDSRVNPTGLRLARTQ